MKFLFRILTTIAVVLTSRGSCVFGELTILRGAPYENPGKTVMSRNLTCVSEDDLSAITWNGYFANTEYPLSNSAFIDLPTTGNKLDCPFIDMEKCDWKPSGNWTIVNSLVKPMGPVMDRRWEGFKMISTDFDEESRHVSQVTGSGSIIFSVVGTLKATLLLCHWNHSVEPCIWTTIGEKIGDTLLTRISNDPPYKKNYGSRTDYREQQTCEKHQESILSLTEWRTFILKWSEESKTVTVSNETQQLLSCNLTNWPEIHYLNLRSPAGGLYRFHLYDYYHTTNEMTSLRSPSIDMTESKLCIEMLIGLCAKCRIRILILPQPGDPFTTKLIDSSNNSKEDDPPTWQHVRLIVSRESSKERFQLELRTHLLDNTLNPLWAVANFQICKDQNAVRQSTISVTQIQNKGNKGLSWPEVDCQKLSYTDQSRVRSTPNIDETLQPATQLCDVQKVGPNCKIDCKTVAQNANCMGLAVCISKGCMCVQGFRGTNCRKSCHNNTYGYECLEECDKCERETCDIITGLCEHGCKENKLRPYCQNDPPAVRELEIYETNINDRTVHLRWLPPKDNKGEIEHYELSSTSSQRSLPSINIPPNNTCELWKQYICYTAHNVTEETNFTVRIKNKGSQVPSKKATIGSATKNFKAPGAPGNLTIKMKRKGVVILEWLHPFRTNTRINKFIIIAFEIDSDLQKKPNKSNDLYEYYLINKYQSKYDKQLDLLPSTKYEFRVMADANKLVGKSSSMEAWTLAAPAFENDLRTSDKSSNHTVRVEIPSISNDTKGSIMHVIVKGKVPCKSHTDVNGDLRFHINLTDSECAWIAASHPSVELKGQNFTIGDNETNKNIWNCPLTPGKAYEIVVALESVSNHTKNVIIVSSFLRVEVPWRVETTGLKLEWLYWLFGILIIAVLAVLFAYRRCKRRPKRFNDDNIKFSREEIVFANLVNDTIEMGRTSPPMPQRIWRASNDYVKGGVGDRASASAEYDYISLVKTRDFECYVKDSVARGLLRQQFAIFPSEQTKPWDYGMLPQNMKKNRDGVPIAYDDTRVVLEKLSRDPHSDYINANYVNCYNGDKAYIATQGPLRETVVDFWRMIWQEDVHIICMLTNLGKTKCEQYWPEVGSEKKYGKITILNVEHKVFTDYTTRTFQITCGSKERKVKHLHYTGWPDQGVPTYFYSLVAYLKKLAALTPRDGPVVVHCSAGAGPTGVIILSDICLRQGAMSGNIDVLTETKKIFKQRANILINSQEYLLVHLAVVECLISQQTALPCDDALAANILRMREDTTDQQQRLYDSVWQDKVLHPNAQRPLPAGIDDINEYPANEYDYLYSDKIYEENSVYVSADYVDRVKLINQYVTTQLPSDSTFSDFWELITERKVELIVMLQVPDPEDPTCYEIVQDSVFTPSANLTITLMAETDAEYFTTQKLQLVDTSKEEAKMTPVTILRCKGWTGGTNGKPPSAKSLIELWQASQKVSRAGPAVTVCHDGLTGCGLYLSLTFLLERMSVDHECDVCFAVRSVRQSKPQFIPTREQIEFLYDAAMKYSEYFATYSNFN